MKGKRMRRGSLAVKLRLLVGMVLLFAAASLAYMLLVLRSGDAVVAQQSGHIAEQLDLVEQQAVSVAGPSACRRSTCNTENERHTRCRR